MPTYVPLATITVSSTPTTTLDFTSIPQTYMDLALKISSRVTRTGQSLENLEIRFNNNTSNYANKVFEGSNNVAGSYTNGQTNLTIVAYVNTTDSLSNTFASTDVYIPRYRDSVHKHFSSTSVLENNSSTAYWVQMYGGRWEDNTAITSIQLFNTNGLALHTNATLYGISNT